MRWKFERGHAYWAVPALDGAPKRVVACESRDGGHVVLHRIRVADMQKCRVLDFDGGEVATIDGDDGHHYTVSAAVEVDLDKAARVMEAMS